MEMSKRSPLNSEFIESMQSWACEGGSLVKMLMGALLDVDLKDPVAMDRCFWHVHEYTPPCKKD
jgi:hypothetical protein